MERILKGSPTTIQTTFYVGEEPTDADGDVTVEVVRENGDVLVAAGSAASAGASGDGIYAYQLTPTELDRVDILTARWSGTFSGIDVTLQTEYEVVGGFYFTLADARASDSALVSTTKYTMAQIVEARDEVEDECESITGVAWVRRYGVAYLNGKDRAAVIVPDMQVRQVFSVEVDGVAYTSDELADLALPTTGIITRRTLGVFTAGAANVVVRYEHGHDAPPSDLRRAALRRLQHRLFATKSAIPDRATTYTAGEGGTFGLATAGRGGSWTGIPEVDAVYDRYRVVVPAIA